MLDLDMKMSMNAFKFKDNEGKETEGIKFSFRDLDYTHEQTLMLVSGGEPVADVHKNPLYALQGVNEGEMVKVRFVPFQQRQQDQRNGSRDRVRDVLSLRLDAVQPSSNGKG